VRKALDRSEVEGRKTFRESVMIDSKYTSIFVFFLAAACYYYLTKESLFDANLHLKYDYVIGEYSGMWITKS
jgi:hypothetical protein